eukprot:3098562-Rhodomonas_salina.3
MFFLARSCSLQFTRKRTPAGHVTQAPTTAGRVTHALTDHATHASASTSRKLLQVTSHVSVDALDEEEDRIRSIDLVGRPPTAPTRRAMSTVEHRQAHAKKVQSR